MNKYLDERQEQSLGRYAVISFYIMYVISAIAIVVQLYVGGGNLLLVLGETIIMVAGGVVYLYGIVKTGTFSANGICKGKTGILVNICISILVSSIFSLTYGIILNGMSKNETINIGKVVAMFFAGITVLCIAVLEIMRKISINVNRKNEMKYMDSEELPEKDPEFVKIYMANTSVEADMLIGVLAQNGISAYKQSIDGGVMDVYSGNSNIGDYIFVNSEKIEEANQIIEEYKLS